MANSISLLNEVEIKKYITDSHQKKIAAFDIFDQIDSTNNYLLQLDSLPKDKISICLAEEQVEGRGRLGRKWISPHAANIYLSLLWPFKKEMYQLSGLSLAITAILHQVLASLGIKNIELKWPNDLLYQNQKLAGILIETMKERSGIVNVVIGIGLNIAMQPQYGEQIDQPWIDLQSILKKQCDRNQIAGLIIDALLEALPQFETKGLAPFLPIWKKHHLLQGQMIQLISPNKIIEGKVKGINLDGHLQLENNAGKIVAYSSGEIKKLSKTLEIV